MDNHIQVVERLIKENAELQRQIKLLNQKIDELLYGKHQSTYNDYVNNGDDIVEFR